MVFFELVFFLGGGSMFIYMDIPSIEGQCYDFKPSRFWQSPTHVRFIEVFLLTPKVKYDWFLAILLQSRFLKPIKSMRFEGHFS